MIIFFQIPDANTRRTNIPVEESSTYVGVIQQKSKQVTYHRK